MLCTTTKNVYERVRLHGAHRKQKAYYGKHQTMDTQTAIEQQLQLYTIQIWNSHTEVASDCRYWQKTVKKGLEVTNCCQCMRQIVMHIRWWCGCDMASTRRIQAEMFLLSATCTPTRHNTWVYFLHIQYRQFAYITAHKIYFRNRLIGTKQQSLRIRFVCQYRPVLLAHHIRNSL